MIRDAVVIGGGFYGTAIAVYLSKRGLRNILLVEGKKELLTRASYNNQARVHNGYHYPRSFITAYRSRINLPRFVKDWEDSIKKNFEKIYAIPRRNSKVTANQFERFCEQIGASFQRGSPSVSKLFDSKLIEQSYIVEEYAFDTSKLAAWARRELESNRIEVRCSSIVRKVSRGANDTLDVAIEEIEKGFSKTNARYVFNCTYSGLNQITGDLPELSSQLKHEITEMALIKMPPALERIGVTVMDGPFFSAMPFPARDLHTLSHVRYTPHMHWLDKRGSNPYTKLDEYVRQSRVDRMIRDAGRYMPALLQCKHIDSLFEVKTVLQTNETDDGRPILFEKHDGLPGCFSILGGKIDNIYDVLEKLDTENFHALKA